MKAKDYYAPTDSNPFYNFENYPFYFGQHCQNWVVCHDGKGHTAAIAVDKGCKSTHYGPISYAAMMLWGKYANLAISQAKP
jgi:hypothetical protein